MPEHTYTIGQRIWVIPREGEIVLRDYYSPRDYEIMYSGTILSRLDDGRYYVHMDSGYSEIIADTDMLPKPEEEPRGFRPTDHTWFFLGAIIATALFGAWLLG